MYWFYGEIPKERDILIILTWNEKSLMETKKLLNIRYGKAITIRDDEGTLRSEIF